MGGGTVWRGMSRLVSPTARVASASAGSSTSCSFCKIGASSSAQAPKAQSARLGGGACACTPETSLQAGRTSQQGAPLAMLEPDDWEFAEEERLDHIVFGSLPSRTEVEEASSELQGALRLGLVAPAIVQASSPRAGSPELIEQKQQSVGASSTVGEGEEVPKPIVANRLALDWMEPPPISTSQTLLQRGGRNNVAEAFHQFQHNPEVQNMVVSLATDPAIWDAVMANEKIQEFKRKLEGDKGIFTEKEPLLVEPTEVAKTLHQEPSILMRLQAYWQDKLSKFVDTLSNIINGFLSAADKKVFAGEDGDVLDRVVKSCSMLAVVVVCIVLLKRSNIQVS